MNNTSITKFRWSQKTDSILNKLGIFTIADFEGVSLKALKEMGIPEKTIKQIEDICKVHNIKTKETDLRVYRIKADIYDIYTKWFYVIACDSENAMSIAHNCLLKYYKDSDISNMKIQDSSNIYNGLNIFDI